jgi:hypothetical protein
MKKIHLQKKKKKNEILEVVVKLLLSMSPTLSSAGGTQVVEQLKTSRIFTDAADETLTIESASSAPTGLVLNATAGGIAMNGAADVTVGSDAGIYLQSVDQVGLHATDPTAEVYIRAGTDGDGVITLQGSIQADQSESTFKNITAGNINSTGNVVIDNDLTVTGNASFLAQDHAVTSDTPQTINNSSDQQVSGMVLSPSAGTHYVSFNCQMDSEVLGNSTATFSVYHNGVQISNSIRTRALSSGVEMSLDALATIDAGQTIDVRVRVNTNSVTLQRRIMMSRRISLA